MAFPITSPPYVAPPRATAAATKPIPTTPPFLSPSAAAEFAAEVASKAGQRDLAIVFALITLAIPLFVVSIRLFHPRRTKQYAVHDILVFIATFFAICTTAAIISELKIGMKPMAFPISRKALSVLIASTMNFYLVIILARMSLLFFALQEFGDRTQRQAHRVRTIRVFIMTMMALVLIQGFSAMFTTLAACAPVSSAWNPRRFRQDCQAHSRIQVINAATDLSSYFVVLVGLVILYVRTGVQRRLISFRLCILAVGLMTVVAGGIRTGFLVDHLKEILPPVKHVEPQILEAVEMDLGITTAALLALCGSIRRHQNNNHKEDVESNRGWKSFQTSYLDMPDLEFKSENKITGLQGRKDKLDMLDAQILLESPTLPAFPRPPSRTATPSSRPRSLPATASQPLTIISPEARASIPPMPLIAKSDMPAQTLPQIMPARKNSISSTASSELSSGPFSDSDVDDGEALILSIQDEDLAEADGSAGKPNVRFADTRPVRRRGSVVGLIDALREVPPGTAITTVSGKGTRR